MKTMQRDPGPAFTHVDDDVLVSLISSARERLVFLAPGVSKRVADALSERWRTLGPGRVNVILDADAEVCRLGLGTIEGLKKLEATAKALGTLVAYQPQVRLGLVVADSAVVMYTPEPLLVTDPAAKPNAVNAIRLDTVPPAIERETGIGPDGARDQTVGLDRIPPNTIKAVERDLEANPPLQFDIARTLRVFNAHFEFVELKVEGCAISRRRVPIPSDLLGLARDERTRNLLRSSFHIVGPGLQLNEERVMRLRKFIADRYLIPLKGYGNVVLRSNKNDLITAVEALRRYVARFQRRVEKKIQAEIDRNREALVRALTPGVAANPPARWLKHLGQDRSEQAIRTLLDRELKAALGTAGDLIQEMKVSLVFKAVTYESLNDPDFMKLAREAMPTLAKLHEEFQAVRGTRPAALSATRTFDN